MSSCGVLNKIYCLCTRRTWGWTCMTSTSWSCYDSHMRVGHWILPFSQFHEEMGNDFKTASVSFRSSLVFPQKNPHLSLHDDKMTSSFWNTYTLWEHVPKRHQLKIYLSLCDNVWRKPNSKSELGSHEGRALTWASLVTVCITQQEEGQHSAGSRCLATARERPPRLPPPASHWEATTTWTLIFLQRTLVQNSPSQLPSFLFKRMLSSFVLETCLWCTTVCLSWIAISLLFWINSILLAELLLFLFQNVDNVNNLNSVPQGKV